ncbi:MAG: flagellar hook-basal body complex protein [Alphaproteobacteria bacterium]|nr:MAG: flagellar hook-basal body complex protein [Alphaproteobacteria bacterium]
MDNAAYVALTRQVGLMKAMQVTANNIANLSTTGFRREDVLFAEMLVGQPDAPGTLAMTAARVRHTDMTQGPLRVTGGSLDFGLEGPGFFMVETPQGPRLTRAGAFSRSADGEMVTMDGLRVLDAGGAPIFLPPDAAAIAVAADGTISADGRPIGQIGLFEVDDPGRLIREAGQLFAPDGIEPLPAEQTRVVQGSLEGSNVDPVLEMARMIEVQRSYELGANFLEREDERIRAVIRTLGQPA